MDTLECDRSLIETILIKYTEIPYAYGEFHTEALFDRARDRYALINVGWDGRDRVHGCLVHIDIIDGKFWIQRDGIEHGIVTELLDAGIPKDRIVMAYKSIERRRLMEFAVN
jgi:XisI protein